VPEDPPTIVSLGIQTGKRVEFQWPTADYPLVRATAKPGNSIAVTYRGDTGAYTVKGSAEIQGGDVFYFDRSFVLKSGKIVFDETQEEFDPRITVRAEIRERDPATNAPIRIYLDADNKLSLFSPKFSSDPPRSDVELMAMIGAPIVDHAGNQLLGGTAMLVLDPLTQFWVLRPFEQKVRSLLGIDSFSLRTQLIPNFLAQKAFGSDVNPLDNTSLSLGKYIGNDLFGEIMVSLHQDQTSTGIPNINLSWEFNLEWATPLFMLNWNFAPRTPQSLFVPDNSISLNWRFSY
jgi:translocation and assembly module TamB